MILGAVLFLSENWTGRTASPGRLFGAVDDEERFL